MIYPDEMMMEIGRKAFKDAMDNDRFLGDRMFEGYVDGRTVIGYYIEIDGTRELKTWWIEK